MLRVALHIFFKFSSFAKQTTKSAKKTNNQLEVCTTAKSSVNNKNNTINTHTHSHLTPFSTNNKNSRSEAQRAKRRVKEENE